MAMTRSDSSVVYEPDGVQERYAVPYPIFSADSVRAVLVEGHTETPLTGFSVEGLDTESGVYVRFFTPPAGQKLVIYRWTKRVQETDYPEGGRFPSKTVEQDFDKLTAMAQEEEDFLETVLRVPRDSSQTPGEYLAAFFHAGEEAISASGAAKEAAKSACSSALEAENSEKNAAASAISAAKSASDAAASLLQGMPDASETRKGILRIATREEAEAGKTDGDDPAALVPESLFNATTTRTGLAKGDEVTAKTGPGGVLSVPGAFFGDLRLLPFRAGELPFGWYICNGELYPRDSPQGKKLSELPEHYKTDWRIAVTSVNDVAYISVPRLFHGDGRGYFLRAANGTVRLPGSVEQDAQQNITGTFVGSSRENQYTGLCFLSHTGVFYNAGGTAYGSTGPILTAPNGTLGMDASRQIRTASEARPLNIGMTPAIFLGV